MSTCGDDVLLASEALNATLPAVFFVAGIVERERVDLRDAWSGRVDGQDQELSVRGFCAPLERRAGADWSRLSTEFS